LLGILFTSNTNLPSYEPVPLEPVPIRIGWDGGYILIISLSKVVE
jgi:hypothetical protein